MSKSKKLKRPLVQQVQHSQQALAQEVVGIIRQEYSGPLPPPHALELYNEIIPNGAERIMVMAEEQGKHRRELEAKAISTDSRNSLLGVLCAFTLGLSTIIAGTIVVFQGHTWQGTIFGSGGLVALVCAFIYGTKERRKERENKARM